MKKHIVQFSFVALALLSCNKHEGPGGTSTVSGKITGRDFDPAEKEITEVIVSQGAELEHGDYWILNSPIGHTLYYIWYDNPVWSTNGDPQLAGRTGIPVVFNYSDSNLEIATNTATAIQTYAGTEVSVFVQSDILIITQNYTGNVADANNMTTNFEINIADQGADAMWTNSSPLADTRVYLVYGDDVVYGEDTRTGADGDYQFSNLVKGNYMVYVVSQDTVSGTGTFKTSASFTINENRSAIELPTLEQIY